MHISWKYKTLCRPFKVIMHIVNSHKVLMTWVQFIWSPMKTSYIWTIFIRCWCLVFNMHNHSVFNWYAWLDWVRCWDHVLNVYGQLTFNCLVGNPVGGGEINHSTWVHQPVSAPNIPQVNQHTLITFMFHHQLPRSCLSFTTVNLQPHWSEI